MSQKLYFPHAVVKLSISNGYALPRTLFHELDAINFSALALCNDIYEGHV